MRYSLRYSLALRVTAGFAFDLFWCRVLLERVFDDERLDRSFWSVGDEAQHHTQAGGQDL